MIRNYFVRVVIEVPGKDTKNLFVGYKSYPFITLTTGFQNVTFFTDKSTAKNLMTKLIGNTLSYFEGALNSHIKDILGDVEWSIKLQVVYISGVGVEGLTSEVVYQCRQECKGPNVGSKWVSVAFK